MPLIFQDKAPIRLNGFFVAAFLLLSIILMSVYSAEGSSGILHQVQSSVRTLISPLERVSGAGGNAILEASETAANMSADEATLTGLRSKNSELTELVAKAEEYRLEAKRLQELLNIRDEYDIKGVGGRIIGRSSDAWSQTITLDVGKNEGVDVGLTVMAPGGVVGQVVTVSNSSCTVRLLSDPKSGVSAMIQGTRAVGVVRGSLSGVLFLEGVETGVEVKVGDVVLTSGLGGSFTKGLLIGTVVRVEGNSSNDSRRIVVAQNEHFTSMEEVLVVFSAKDYVAPANPAPPSADSNTKAPEASGEQSSTSEEGSANAPTAGEGQQ